MDEAQVQADNSYALGRAVGREPEQAFTAGQLLLGKHLTVDIAQADNGAAH